MEVREVQRLSEPADRRLPLLEDEDLAGEAVIEPSRLIRPVDAPTVAVACFFRDVVEELSSRAGAKAVCRLHSEMGPASLWEIEHRGVRLGVFHPGVGAPLAGAMLEQVIARGVRAVIACGGAGALIPQLVMGHAVVLTGAVRDEGTSFHYLPASRVVSADPGPAQFLADALSADGVETMRGLSWSMDAIYRETPGRVSRRVEEGCLVVEMEASALMAIARYRSIPFGEVVMAGDSLAGREWEHRGWMTAKSARRQLFASAADAAVALTSNTRASS
jgi:uridine phosphorylase